MADFLANVQSGEAGINGTSLIQEPGDGRPKTTLANTEWLCVYMPAFLRCFDYERMLSVSVYS